MHTNDRRSVLSPGAIYNYTAVCVPRRTGRFGYEYFEKLSTVAVRELFVEQAPAEAADVDGPPQESELGVITLGVSEVRYFNGRAA